MCEDVDLYEPITFAAQQPQNIVNIVTYNASAPFSLHAWSNVVIDVKNNVAYSDKQ